MTDITIPISPGELLDKLTILEIKRDRVEDVAKRNNVAFELNALAQIAADALPAMKELDTLQAQLKAVNEQLSDIEDAIRACEARQDFGDEFARLARSVYIRNDERARLKADINSLLGSELREEKSYQDYGGDEANV